MEASDLTNFLYPDIDEGRQPQFALEVDWRNPDTDGLIDVIDLRGTPRSLLLGTPVSYFGAPPTASITEEGVAIDSTAAFGGIYFQRPDGAYATAAQTHITVAEYLTPSGIYAGLFAVSDGDGGVNSNSLQYYSPGTSKIYPSGNEASINSHLFGSGISVFGFSSSGPCNFYKNGIQFFAGTNAPTVFTTSRLVIFGERSATPVYAVKGRTFLHFIFSKHLSPDVHASISANPLRIFKAPLDIGWPVSAAIGGMLSAVASGSSQATGSANLAAQVALAAVGISNASGFAAATTSIPLSAAGLAVSTGTADAQATITISAAGLAHAAGQAGLSANILLAGAGAAQAAGNAALAATLQALASGAAQASGSANLFGGAQGSISAAGTIISDGTAILSVSVGLQAAGAAQAAGSAAGQASSPGSVSASGAAQAAGAAILTAVASITAAGFVQAMGAGSIKVSIPLSAFGSATASGSAYLIDSDGSILLVRAPSGAGPALLVRPNHRPAQMSSSRPRNTSSRRY